MVILVVPALQLPSKRVVFVGLVVEHTSVEVLTPYEVHELLTVVDILGGLVVTAALFRNVGVHNTRLGVLEFA